MRALVALSPGLVALSLGLVGCGAPAEPARERALVVVVDTPSGSGIDLSRAEVHATPGSVEAATVHGGRLTVRLRPGSTTVRVTAPGACPANLTGPLPPGESAARLTLLPFIDPGPPRVDVGFDAVTEITVRPGCPEAQAGRIRWKQVAGPPLAELTASADGFQARLRTVPLARALGHEPSWGVIPLSQRTRGEAELELAWEGPGHPALRRTLQVSAAVRSRGLPNVAVGSRIHLAGPGWTVKRTPEGAVARLESSPHGAALLPDAAGRWELEDAAGRGLRIMASRYDETPLDCGRSGCHGAISNTVRSSPMTTILQRGLDGPFPGESYPHCALGCHAAGEPGTDDGGFASVLGRLGLPPEELVRSGYHDLPPSLRRQAGVTCLACHGPGAIPEPSARHDVLRTDVCAYCHDAPPRYGHVTAWQSSPMATADRDLTARTDPACARCHTTWGFLEKPDREPPSHVAPPGITCVACHSVHPAAGTEAASPGRCEQALRREVPPPALLSSAVGAEDPSRVCLPCHTPAPGAAWPTATAAALVYGRGGWDPGTAAALESAPLAPGPRGCLECHAHGPEGLGKGTNHGFRALREGRVSDPQIASRAQALAMRLGLPAITSGAPGHARPPRVDLSTPRGRAAFNVALVLEDPAADIHNAAHARRLLDAAAQVLGEASPP